MASQLENEVALIQSARRGGLALCRTRRHARDQLPARFDQHGRPRAARVSSCVAAAVRATAATGHALTAASSDGWLTRSSGAKRARSEGAPVYAPSGIGVG